MNPHPRRVLPRATKNTMRKNHTTYSIGSSAGISLCIVALALAMGGCGAGTGQSLNAPSLSARTGDGASGAPGTTKGVANSVLPAKRLGLFVSDYDGKSESERVPGATQKPGNFATAANGGQKQKPGDYSHVFVTIHAVELVSADEQSFPVWADDAGRVVDLAAIGGAGQVATLGAVSVPGVTGKKTYKRARITLGKSITFFKRGETTAKSMPIDDAVGRDDEGRPVITVVLNAPRDLGSGKESLVVAFDRSAFTVSDNRVTPALREGRGSTNVDAANQAATYLTGVVSESTAGGDGVDRVFVVTPDGGARGETQVVWLPSSAPFFRADGKPSPTLTDGVRVGVSGVVSGNPKRLAAQSVAILGEDEKPGDMALLRGAATDFNAEAGSITMAVSGLHGVEPTYTQSTVMVGKDAVLRGASGLLQTKEEFFADLKGAGIEAEGEYEPTTGVLTATRLRRVSAGDGKKREATVLATAKSVDGSTLTLLAPLLEWDGIAPPAPGKSWTVNTVSAQCRDKAGKAISLTELLAAVKNPDDNAVRVIGTYSGGTITATRLSLASVPVKEKEAVATSKTAKGKSDKTAPASGAKPDAVKKRVAPSDSADESPVQKPKASPDSPGVI